MDKIRLLTVASVSFLDKVLVLLDSARQHEGEALLTVVLADCTPQRANLFRNALGLDVEVLTSADLNFGFIEGMRSYYSALEFCSALKILAMASIVSQRESCLYLDPDTVIYDRFISPLTRSSSSIVLSPHSLAPMPVDGNLPNDLDFCQVGQVNGGVIWASPEVGRGHVVLDWLANKTRFDWFVAPEQGMYADQQWLSLLPYFFMDQTSFFSDEGINVAYWNLHERPLTRQAPTGNVVLKNGNSLKVFHFSGFQQAGRNPVSQHSERTFDIETQDALSHLSSEYASLLKQARSQLPKATGDLHFSTKSLRRRMRLAGRRNSSDGQSAIP